MAHPSLDDLPDLCLLALFQYVHLLELLRIIRLVNIRWSRLTSAELNRRRSLVIVDDRQFDPLDLLLDQYGSRLIEHVRRDDDALTPWARLPHIDHRNVLYGNNRYFNPSPFQLHNKFPPKMITTLIDSLPRISSLTVVHRFIDLSILDQVIRMIDHWSADLVTLKLSLEEEFGIWHDNAIDGNTLPDDYDEKMSTQIVKLFDSINRAASLKHLKLEFDFTHVSKLHNLNSTNLLPPLTILSQLSSFHSGQLFKNQLDLTLLYDASDNEQLQIATCSQYKLDKLLRIDQEFCAKFVDVEVEDVLTEGSGGADDEGDLDEINRMQQNVDYFCTRFTCLTHLSLKINTMPLAMLSRSLSRLAQLVHLTLLMFDDFEYEDVNLEDQNIVPIPSVRLISLKLFIRAHSSTERLQLPDIFPNLQVLSITDYNMSCVTCELESTFEIDPNRASKLRQCAQLARAPFRACPKLHTIEIDANDSALLSHGLKRLIMQDEL